MIIIRVSQGQAHGDSTGTAASGDAIRWQGSADVTNPPRAETCTNLEMRLETMHNEAQHADLKTSNGTDHESAVSATYKP